MPEKVEPPLMRTTPLDLIAFLWRQRRKVPAVLHDLSSIVQDGRVGKSRSLSADLAKLNELFGTSITTLGAEHIPATGGCVLATAHVVSVPTVPGWINPDVNPVWWAHGIAQAVKTVRGEELHPVAYTRSGERGMHRRIINDSYHGFPVSHRASDKALNRATMMTARNAVESGKVVLIAPEGENRTGLTFPHLGGISRLLVKGMPFVPVAYFEQQKGSDFQYTVSFGEPIVCDFDLPVSSNETNSLPLSAEQREQVAQFVERLMRKIALLLPEQQRGVYSD